MNASRLNAGAMPKPGCLPGWFLPDSFTGAVGKRSTGLRRRRLRLDSEDQTANLASADHRKPFGATFPTESYVNIHFMMNALAVHAKARCSSSPLDTALSWIDR